MVLGWGCQSECIGLDEMDSEDGLDRGNKCKMWKGVREAESEGDVIMEGRLE